MQAAANSRLLLDPLLARGKSHTVVDNDWTSEPCSISNFAVPIGNDPNEVRRLRCGERRNGEGRENRDADERTLHDCGQASMVLST